MINKTKVEINIKSFKIGRILETLLTEALSDFERRHPRIIPALKRGFRNGDPRTGLEKITELQKLVDELKDDLSEIEKITKEDLYKLFSPMDNKLTLDMVSYRNKYAFINFKTPLAAETSNDRIWNIKGEVLSTNVIKVAYKTEHKEKQKN